MLFQEYVEFRRRNLITKDAIEAVADRVVRIDLAPIAKTIVETDLPTVVEMHRDRATEDAAMFLCSESERALKRRLREPLFDLRPFLAHQDPSEAMSALTELFMEIEPCDVLLRGSVGTYRDRTQDKEGIDRTNHLMALSAQQDFMLMHLEGDRFSPHQQ